MTRLVWWILALSVLGCGPGNSAPKNQDRPAAPAEASALSPADEDELMLRLSAGLIAEPATQAQKDQNTIVNYAIDELLPVQSTASGLYYQVLKAGEGPRLQWGDRVRVHYRGYFLDGKEFDSSYRREKAIEFYIGNMIDGWNEGLQLLQPGAQALFLVPAHLGYGTEGLKNGDKYLVPPNRVLAFEVEVLEKI